MVGSELRKLGGEHLVKYSDLLKAALQRAESKKMQFSVQVVDDNKFIPRNAKSFVWRYCHLRQSTPDVWYCNACCPNIGDKPLGSPGCQN